jgi:O-acetyl-ADP-ribose deacetylase (regulator of RNase III)
MGGGIARLIAERYPAAQKADNKTVRGRKEKLGSFTYAEVKLNKYIFNLYGQYEFGGNVRNTNYEALYKGLESIKTFINDFDIKKVVIPYKLASGLAGGDWNVVKAMIYSVFENESDLNVVICRIE